MATKGAQSQGIQSGLRMRCIPIQAYDVRYQSIVSISCVAWELSFEIERWVTTYLEVLLVTYISGASTFLPRCSARSRFLGSSDDEKRYVITDEFRNIQIHYLLIH